MNTTTPFAKYDGTSPAPAFSCVTHGEETVNGVCACCVYSEGEQDYRRWASYNAKSAEEYYRIWD